MERTAHRRERYDTATIYDIEQALARSRGPSSMEHDAHGRDAHGRDDIADDAVPLFLSEPHGQPAPGEFIEDYDYKPRRRFRGLLFVTTSVIGVGLAAAGYGATQRSEILDALPGWLHASSSTAPVPAALAAENRQVVATTKEPSRFGEPPRIASADPAASAPSREAIASAYRSALQGQTPQQVATAAAAPDPGPAPAPAATAGTASITAPPAVDTGPSAATPSAGAPAPALYHLAPAEIASLNKRGDDLIASGDIAAARLVWRRAAEAGDARAAGKLAGTYDPAVLGRLGVHGMVPDLAKARSWYEKAAQLGSADARQRLEALARR